MADLDPVPTYTVRIHKLDATLAELHIEFAHLSADVEVHGRLIGPRWPGVSTVEVAYKLRKRGESPTYQVLIPEPTLWSEDRPCVYEGPVEFWRDGQLLVGITVSVGIRPAPS